MAASLIWLTDRSRYETGTGRCAYARYLRYHAGPTGYGLAHKAESVPLTTGSSVHQGTELLLKILKQHNRLPTVEEVREVVRHVRALYEKKLMAKGFRGGILTGPIVEETIREQSCLIGGLIWTTQLQLLPWLHQEYRILEVEQERLHFLSCTCGLSEAILDQAQHDARGCQGQALMLRTDILAQHRQMTHLAYFEVKTTGWESDAWADQWETKPQLGLGTLDLDKRYGREVTELYLIGMNKGRRAKDQSKEAKEASALPEENPLASMKRQQSALCYGYCRPGNPPLAKDDWLPAYEWVTDAGEVKRKSKAHKRLGIWELEQSDWSVWRAYKGSDPTLSYDEFWYRQLPQSILDKICFVLGPLNRQDHQIQSLRRSMKAEESRWQEILWKLYEAQQPPSNVVDNAASRAAYGWASEGFQAKADALIPRSWNCRPYGKEHECEMVPICFRQAGWDDPIGSGKYQARLPHHTPETEQAVLRGLLTEQAEELEEE